MIDLQPGDRVRFTARHLRQVGLDPATAVARVVGEVVRVRSRFVTVRWSVDVEGDARPGQLERVSA